MHILLQWMVWRIGKFSMYNIIKSKQPNKGTSSYTRGERPMYININRKQLDFNINKQAVSRFIVIAGVTFCERVYKVLWFSSDS